MTVRTATVEWVEEPLRQCVRAADIVRRYCEMDTRNSEKGREKIETATIRHGQNHFLGIVLLIASRGCDIKAGEAHLRGSSLPDWTGLYPGSALRTWSYGANQQQRFSQGSKKIHWSKENIVKSINRFHFSKQSSLAVVSFFFKLIKKKIATQKSLNAVKKQRLRTNQYHLHQHVSSCCSCASDKHVFLHYCW